MRLAGLAGMESAADAEERAVQREEDEAREARADWECGSCASANSGLLSLCEACAAPYISAADLEWVCGNCTCENRAYAAACAACQVERDRAADGWKCAQCHSFNRASAACAACDMERAATGSFLRRRAAEVCAAAAAAASTRGGVGASASASRRREAVLGAAARELGCGGMSALNFTEMLETGMVLGRMVRLVKYLKYSFANTYGDTSRDDGVVSVLQHTMEPRDGCIPIRPETALYRQIRTLNKVRNLFAHEIESFEQLASRPAWRGWTVAVFADKCTEVWSGLALLEAGSSRELL